jgi:DNA modification methylase
MPDEIKGLGEWVGETPPQTAPARLEDNRVHKLDCLEGMKLMADNSVDLIVTDPPYFIEALKENLKEATIRGSSRNSIFYNEFDHFKDLEDYQAFISKVLVEFQRILKDKAQVYMFFSYHHLDWAIRKIKDMGFRYYKPIIWYKPDIMGVFPNQYGCNYEVILWFRKKGDTGEVKLNIGNAQRDVFKINSTTISYRKECGFHPTPKPFAIIKQFIKNGSNEGDLVCDPFMGSGTTAVAAKFSQRRYIGFEINAEYIKICEKRLAQMPLFSFMEGETYVNNTEGGDNGLPTEEGAGIMQGDRRGDMHEGEIRGEHNSPEHPERGGL